MTRIVAICIISIFLMPLSLNKQGGVAKGEAVADEGQSVMKMPRGKVIIDKKVEDITASDVLSAYRLKGVAVGVPVMESIPKDTVAPFVITGEGLGLVPGYYDVASTTQTRLESHSR